MMNALTWSLHRAWTWLWVGDASTRHPRWVVGYHPAARSLLVGRLLWLTLMSTSFYVKIRYSQDWNRAATIAVVTDR